MEQYSNIFGDRKYRAHYILEEFCDRYYDKEVYNILTQEEYEIKEYVNNKLKPYIDLYNTEGTIKLIKDQINKLAEYYAGQYFNTIVEPNGEMKYPDYIINIGDHKDIYLDAKCVAYIPRKSNDTDNPLVVYNNKCGQVYLAAKNILEHYKGEDNKFYKSFILYMYYNEEGYLEDVLFAPTIYAINLKKYDWDNLNTFEFQLCAAQNGNIVLSMPTFLKKNGMLTLDEKELAIATAAHNYIQKHLEEFTDDNIC